MSGIKGKTIGQSVIEYLLLLSVVAILALVAMKPGGIADQLQNKALDYYHEGAKKIKNIQ